MEVRQYVTLQLTLRGNASIFENLVVIWKSCRLIDINKNGRPDNFFPHSRSKTTFSCEDRTVSILNRVAGGRPKGMVVAGEQ